MTRSVARPAAPVGVASSRQRQRLERDISLPFDVSALSTRRGRFWIGRWQGTGLRPVEYAVYSLMLEAGPEPIGAGGGVGRPPSTMSGYLRPMLERGDAERIPNPADGRSFRVALKTRVGPFSAG